MVITIKTNKGKGEIIMLRNLFISGMTAIIDDNNMTETARGFSNVRANDFKDAAQFFGSVGINIVSDGTYCTKGLTLVIREIPSMGITVRNPFTYEVNQDTLIMLHERFKSLGYNGALLLKALADAVFNTDDNVYVYLKNNKIVVKMFFTYIEELFTNNELPELKINRSTVSSIMKSFGGYRGIRTIVDDALSTIYLALVNSVNATCDKHMCLTCKYCKVDSYGRRYCKEISRSLPDNMTIDDAQRMYPEVFVYEGRMLSKYIPTPIDSCNSYRSRKPKFSKKNIK